MWTIVVDIDNLFINISLDRYLSTDIGCRVWWANLLHSIQAITLVQWYVPEGHKVVTKTKSMSRDSHKTNTSLSDSLTQLSRVYQVSPIQPAVIAFTQAHLLQQALLQLSGFSLEIKFWLWTATVSLLSIWKLHQKEWRDALAAKRPLTTTIGASHPDSAMALKSAPPRERSKARLHSKKRT